VDYREILDHLAPCGLNWFKCVAYAEGEIRLHSTRLKELLGSFDRYAERFSTFIPAFKNYRAFKEILSVLAQGDCKGCRSGEGKYPNCVVLTCHREKKVDFCFQCREFPCDKVNFDQNLKERWIRMNERMRRGGVETYYEETKDLPRYR